ncbi:uncharacterized protein [Palaemon carinicauda]|uniref:uncharacterized protein n=1 Tax=Palaemon carinicauda TaxID=392227 RepID=UPI0035B690D9
MFKIIFLVTLATICATHPQLGFEAPSGPSYSYGAPDLQGAASTLNGALSVFDDPIAALTANIPGGGIPGEDYPILASVPDTGFTCADQEFPGYYADTADEAGCQVFHICQFDGRLDSFLCPNGTIFNQQYFVCDWWFNVDCSATDQFIALNADIGKVADDILVGAASDISLSNSYGAPQQVAAPSNSYGVPA